MTPDEASAFISELDASGERHRVMYGGGRFMWRRFGQGHPLVLLHGGHGSWLHWVRNIAYLARTRAVWVPDMPGYGESDALDRSAGLEELVVAVLAMLDEIFEKTEIDLAGFSFGGKVAATVTARRGPVRKLALMGSAGHGGTRRQAMDLVNWRTSRDDAELEAAMRHNLAAHMLWDPAKIEALALAAHIRSCRETRFRSNIISRRGDLHTLLSQRDIPMLLTWGEHDITADPAVVVPLLTTGYANRRGKIISGGGHWVQCECHDEINPLLDEWFNAS